MSAPTEGFRHAISEEIRSHAVTYPETVEGTSCVNRAFKAGGKNFLFLGEKDGECNMRLKLKESIDEMHERDGRDPGSFGVGMGGWTLIKFPPDEHPPLADLQRWIAESFRLLAPKKVVALLDG